MTGGHVELAMLLPVVILMVLIFAGLWFVFMVPMEKGLHRRRMELLQQKLRRNEARLQREGRVEHAGDGESRG